MDSPDSEKGMSVQCFLPADQEVIQRLVHWLVDIDGVKRDLLLAQRTLQLSLVFFECLRRQGISQPATNVARSSKLSDQTPNSAHPSAE